MNLPGFRYRFFARVIPEGGVHHAATGMDSLGETVECTRRLDVGRHGYLPRVRPDIPSISADAGVSMSAVSGDGVSSKKTEKKFARAVTNE